MKPAATEVKVPATLIEDSTSEAPATDPDPAKISDGDPPYEAPAIPPKTPPKDDVSAEGPDPGWAPGRSTNSPFQPAISDPNLGEAPNMFPAMTAGEDLPGEVPVVSAEFMVPAPAKTLAEFLPGKAPDAPAEEEIPVGGPNSGEIPAEAKTHTIPTEVKVPEAVAQVATEVPPGGSTSHTILLFQPDARPETKTYRDYESVEKCMEGVNSIHEEYLIRTNPSSPPSTHAISQSTAWTGSRTKSASPTPRPAGPVSRQRAKYPKPRQPQRPRSHIRRRHQGRTPLAPTRSRSRSTPMLKSAYYQRRQRPRHPRSMLRQERRHTHPEKNPSRPGCWRRRGRRGRSTSCH